MESDCLGASNAPNTDRADPERNLFLLPSRAIIIEAGIVAAAMPMIMKPRGSVARSLDGAIWVPMMPSSRTIIGAAVWPKLWAAKRTIRVR